MKNNTLLKLQLKIKEVLFIGKRNILDSLLSENGLVCKWH